MLPTYQRNQSIRERKGQIRDCVKHEFEGESKQIHHAFPKQELFKGINYFFYLCPIFLFTERRTQVIGRWRKPGGGLLEGENKKLIKPYYTTLNFQILEVLSGLSIRINELALIGNVFFPPARFCLIPESNSTCK